MTDEDRIEELRKELAKTRAAFRSIETLVATMQKMRPVDEATKEVANLKRQLAEAQEAIRDDIANQEAESLADAKRRLAKRRGAEPSMTTTDTRDEGVAALKRICDQLKYSSHKEITRARDGNNKEYILYSVQLTGDDIAILATLSRQLAEARAELNMWRASFPGSAEAVKRDAKGTSPPINRRL